MKIFLTLLFLANLLSPAIAKETITIVYSWSAADMRANYSRIIVEEANKLQNKYNFIFDAKPGAGSSMAANYVKNTPNTILSTSSAFFVRPNFFPIAESHNVLEFKEIYLQCVSPLAITSMKFKNWSELPTNKPLTIGVSGLGTTTHLFATQIQVKYPLITVVPFKSTVESLMSVAGGHTDLHVAFLGEVETWGVDNPKFKRLHVLGTSGHVSVRGFPTLVSQGFGNTVAGISVPFHFAVPITVSNDLFMELRSILIKAGASTAVKELYKLDACVPGALDNNSLNSWYKAQIEQWKTLSRGVKLEQ